jgi:hypothetical protein
MIDLLKKSLVVTVRVTVTHSAAIELCQQPIMVHQVERIVVIAERIDYALPNSLNQSYERMSFVPTFR